MYIFDKCTYYTVDMCKLSNDKILELRESLSINTEDDTKIYMSKTNIEKFDIPDIAIDYDSLDFDEDELEYILEEYLGSHNFYLVFGNNIRWNGESGYTIVDNIIDTVKRNYDCSINIIENPNKDVIICMESSHDCSTGSQVIIIGLTNQEYELLEELDFDDISNFVETKCK